MSDAAWFITVTGGLFVLHAIAATIVFLGMHSEGDRCPQCDAQTLHVEGRRLVRWIPRMRPSWCIACGWEGLLRRTARKPTVHGVEPSRRATPR